MAHICGAIFGYLVGVGVLAFAQVSVEALEPSLALSPLWNFLFDLSDAGLLLGVCVLALGSLGFRYRDVDSGLTVGRAVTAFLAGVAIYVAVRLAFHILHISLEDHPALLELAESPDRLHLLFGLVSTLTLAPLSEEILVRGLLHNALGARIHLWANILLGNALFAALHVFPSIMLYSFVAGVLISRFYARNRSLAAAVLVHFTINLCSVAELLLGKE